MTRLPPSSTLFPYTTLFRSGTYCGIFFQLLCPHIASVFELRPEYECRRTISSFLPVYDFAAAMAVSFASVPLRSEEHTSELQSHSDLVCRLLLEKKKKIDNS